jgi:hypothetical protein
MQADKDIERTLFVNDLIETLIGRPPRSLRDWIQGHRDALLGRSTGPAAV